MPANKPWMRCEGEPGKAYDAFLSYLFLAPSERSLATAAGVKTRQEHGKSTVKLRTFEKWSVVFNWVARVTAYDDHRAAELFMLEEDATRAMSAKRVQAQEAFLESERQVSESVFKKLEVMLGFPLMDTMIERTHPDGQAHVTIVKAAKWNWGTVAKLAEVWQTVGRAGLNMPPPSTFNVQALAAQTVDAVLSAAKVALSPEDYQALLNQLARENL